MPRLGSGLDRPPMEVGPFARPVSAVHPTRGGAYALPRADMFLSLRPSDTFASEPARAGPWLDLDTNQQLSAKPAANLTGEFLQSMVITVPVEAAVSGSADHPVLSCSSCPNSFWPASLPLASGLRR